MAKMIFVCRECNSIYRAKSRTHNFCPDCDIPLIETTITYQYWKKLSSSQKEKVQPNLLPFAQGKYAMFCHYCGTAIMNETVICPGCGCLGRRMKPEGDLSIGMVILSILFPLFGGIYFFEAIKTRPKCAKVCSIVAIISWLTGLSNFMVGFIAGLLGIL